MVLSWSRWLKLDLNGSCRCKNWCLCFLEKLLLWLLWGLIRLRHWRCHTLMWVENHWLVTLSSTILWLLGGSEGCSEINDLALLLSLLHFYGRVTSILCKLGIRLHMATHLLRLLLRDLLIILKFSVFFLPLVIAWGACRLVILQGRLLLAYSELLIRLGCLTLSCGSIEVVEVLIRVALLLWICIATGALGLYHRW